MFFIIQTLTYCKYYMCVKTNPVLQAVKNKVSDEIFL
jgi:hypothetical protein